MNKVTNFEKHFKEEMKSKKFRDTYYQEGVRLEIAYKINQLRRAKRLSQKELAAKIGTTQSAIARIEMGNQNFTTEMLEKIAVAVGCKLKIEFV